MKKMKNIIFSSGLSDPVDEYFIEEFLRLDDEANVHPEPEYTIHRCRAAANLRVTRSKAAKRRHSDYEPHFHTYVKKARRSTPNTVAADSEGSKSSPGNEKGKKGRSTAPGKGEEKTTRDGFSI